MLFPAKLTNRVKLTKGPVSLGQPILGPGAIYLAGRQIYRIDSNDLRIVWRKECELSLALFVLSNILFLTSGLELIALDPTSSETLWTRGSKGGFLWRDRLLTLEPDSAIIVDPSTGKAMERIDLPGRSAVHGFNGDTLLYRIGEDGSVAAAYDLAERRLLWERPLLEETIKNYRAPGQTMNLTPGEKTFVLTKADVGIFGCSMEDGRILWHHRAFVSRDAPIAFNGRVYALTTGHVPTLQDAAKLICVDEFTGEKIYETEHKEFLAYRPSRPTVYEDHVYFGSDGGFVFAFRLADGALVWRHRTTGQTRQPTILEDRLYVTSDDGHLLFFEGKKSLTKTKAGTKNA